MRCCPNGAGNVWALGISCIALAAANHDPQRAQAAPAAVDKPKVCRPFFAKGVNIVDVTVDPESRMLCADSGDIYFGQLTATWNFDVVLRAWTESRSATPVGIIEHWRCKLEASRIVSDVDLRPTIHVSRWSVPKILDYHGGNGSGPNTDVVDMGAIRKHIGPQLTLSRCFGHPNAFQYSSICFRGDRVGAFSCCNSSNACFSRVSGKVGGTSGLDKSPPYEKQPGSRKNGLNDGDPEHPFIPDCHINLSIYIFTCAVTFLLGFGICIGGFKRMDDAVEKILDGQRIGWVGAALGLSFLSSGVGLAGFAVVLLVQGLCVTRTNASG